MGNGNYRRLKPLLIQSQGDFCAAARKTTPLLFPELEDTTNPSCQAFLGVGTDARKTADVDHIKPRSPIDPCFEAGSNNIGNLQVLCRECHQTKSGLEQQYREGQIEPEEFLTRVKRFWSEEMIRTFENQERCPGW